MLNNKGWPCAYISGAQDQQDRLTAMDKLKVNLQFTKERLLQKLWFDKLVNASCLYYIEGGKYFKLKKRKLFNC